MTNSETLDYISCLNGSSLKQVLLGQMAALLDIFYNMNALVLYKISL